MIKNIYQITDQYYYQKMTKMHFGPKAKLNFLFDSLIVLNDIIYIMKDDQYVVIGNTIYDESCRENGEEDSKRLILSRSSYEDVVLAWNLNVKNPKKYLVLTQDQDGLITLEAKDELSKQDLQALEEDRQAGLKWEEKWKKQIDDYWVKKKWLSLKYNLSRLWLRFRQWLQM